MHLCICIKYSHLSKDNSELPVCECHFHEMQTGVGCLPSLWYAIAVDTGLCQGQGLPTHSSSAGPALVFSCMSRGD